MQITSKRVGEKLILALDGRLDANWSEYAGSAIESEIQNGEHRIEIDLEKVQYISSAGIGMLLKYQKYLTRVNGEFRVCNPVEHVRAVLSMMKLDKLLLSSEQAVAVNATSATETTLEVNGFRFESYALPGGKPIQCEWVGHPERFSTGQLTIDDSISVRLDLNQLLLGLGAFRDNNGNRKESSESCGRFGEALGVAGIAIEQPADGSRVPDFQIARELMLPEIQLLYGILGTGDFSHLIRVEAGRSERGSIRFSKFIEGVLDSFACRCGCFVMVVEAAAVVGAALIQSPTDANGRSPWEYPGIRDWLSFTTEQQDGRVLSLIVGLACKSPEGRARTFLRPLSDSSAAEGHFHAAVFPYRPLAKGLLSMAETVRGLFDADTPKTVLHLLSDDRPIEGIGETEILRGACWFGPAGVPVE